MNKEFIPYEEALVLKELGFNEPCFSMFMKDELKLKCYCHNSEFIEPHQLIFISAPTFSQAFRWFREKHNLRNWIESIDINHKAVIVNHYGVIFNSHEEAELACLKKLIEIVKNK
jgi:hypothetical protein